MTGKFFIKILWDEEAKVWSIVDSDVPGLVAEAPSQAALLAKIRILVPELLELNGYPGDWRQGEDVPISVFAEKLEHISLGR